MLFRSNIINNLDNLILYIYATPGPSKVSLFISNKTIYPCKKKCEWSTEEKTQQDNGEIQLDPFILNNENKLEYNLSLEDQLKLVHNPESIGLKIYGYHFKRSSHTCYIGILNSTDKIQKGTIQIIEYTETQLLPKVLKSKAELFNELFNCIDGGEISKNERNTKNLSGPEFVYGEIEFSHFIFLLKMVYKETDKIFWDLGAGIGKVMIATALSALNFKRICGVEILDGLCDSANNIIKGFCKYTKCDEELFKFVKGDIRTIDWSDADIIYSASLCFPEELLKEISEKGRMLKKGTRIITMKKWSISDIYKVITCFSVKMTWGYTTVYVLEKL